MIELSTEHRAIVDRAALINGTMGANLAVLLKFGVVTFNQVWTYQMLLNHLQTHENFDIKTGFEVNKKRMIIWLDTITEPLKEELRKKY